jgi:hypothetical protein
VTPVPFIAAAVLLVTAVRIMDIVHRYTHTDDPESSRRAFRDLMKSSAYDTQKAIVLEAVKRWPGRTSRELAYEIVQAGVLIGRPLEEKFTVARRLSILHDEAWVSQGELRDCGVCRRLCVTWYPA